MLKKIIKIVIPRTLVEKIFDFKKTYFDGFSIKSYSQEGEDMILRRLFEHQRNGFYVDVGAHHPMRFSNTYYFYKKGWNGINIDAMPGCMRLFNKFRSRDINIEKPVSNRKEVLTYYGFNEPALNGFSRRLAEERENNYKIIFQKQIEASTLEEILDESFPREKEFDFLSIDVEGMDFLVLQSVNLGKYRPKVIVIEMLRLKLEDVVDHEISNYLKNFDYILHSKAFHSVVFVSKEFYSKVYY